MSSTSSTPASAAMSSTASMTRWRMSGRFIWGSGSEMSSNAIVSFMPGTEQRRKRLGVERLQQRIADRAVDVVDAVERLGRVDSTRAGGKLVEPEPLAVVEQQRGSRPIDVEDEPGAGHQRFLSRSLRMSNAIFTAAAAARGGGVLDRIVVARQGIGGRDEPLEPGRRDEIEGEVERAPLLAVGHRLGAVGVRADQLRLAVPERGEVELDRARHPDEHDGAARAAPSRARRRSSSRIRRSRGRCRRRR